MKTLIIGANGFLGRALVNKCLDKKWKVDCLYHSNKEFIPTQCKCFHIDDLETLDDSYDVIFLLSSFIPYGSFNIPDKRFIETNIKIPLRTIEKFKKSKIIFSSSTSVYGLPDLTISENSSFVDPTLYGLSKLGGEFILQSHPDYQIIRFTSIYGQGMYPDTFIPKILNEAQKKKIITLFGKGSRLQNYLYIEDAIGYIMAAAKRKESGIYLGVDSKSYSNAQVAGIIQKLIPGCKINYVGSDNSPSFVYNNSVSTKLLDYSVQFTLEKGIQHLIK